MRRLFVIYGGKWNEVGTVYEGGVMGGLDVDETITYTDLVNALHRLTRVDPDKFNIVIECMYKFEMQYEVPKYFIFDDSSLRFYLTGPPDPSQVPLYVSVLSKRTYGSGSKPGDSSSFPYYPSQKIPSLGPSTSIDSPYPPYSHR